MNYKVLFVIFTILGFIGTSFSEEEDCAKEILFSLIREDQRDFQIHPSIANPEKIRTKLNDFFTEIDQMMAGNLYLPTDLKIDLTQTSDIALFSKRENKLRIPVKLLGEEGKVKKYIYDSMVAHEYGHSIFHRNLAKVDPWYMKNINTRREYDEITKEIKHLESMKTDFIRLNSLRFREEKLRIKNDKAELDTMFVKAYHELFADLIAVMKMDDRDAMKMLKKVSSEGSDGMERSFNSNIEYKGWDHQAPHYLFAPVRAYLGNVMKTGIEDKGKFVKNVFNVMAEHLQKSRGDLHRQFKQDPTKQVYEYEIDVEKMNSTLIEDLYNNLDPNLN